MNSFGSAFRVTLFGESHGPGIGVTIDGVPSGMSLCADDFKTDITRRAPLRKGTTPRHEEDVPQFVSGLHDGHTTGAPLTILFSNSNFSDAPYSGLADTPRPGHADFAASIRWNGDNDLRGGGQFSGRMTLPVVAAGVVAKKVLGDVRVSAHLAEIGGCPDPERWDALIGAAAADGDSLGGIVECSVMMEDPLDSADGASRMPAGLGEPFWDSVESLLAHAVFAIPGIRGIEFGDGFRASSMKGSEHNDPFGPYGPLKNGSGGVNGGLTNGAPIHFRVAVKPTSSISRPQKTWNFKTGEQVEVCVKGQHDVCFALRTPVVVEAMSAIVLADLILH